MDLSIVIVNWNTREMLRECLDSLFNNIKGLDYEVIVVDNGSTDGSTQMVVEQFPDVRVIENRENVGFARANNQGISLSSGKYILLLNSDAFIQDDSIQKMLAVLEANPRVAIAGAKLVYPDGSPQVSHGPLPTLTIECLRLFGLDKILEIGQSADHFEEFIETGTVEGACFLTRRQALDQIGVMDEGYFFFSEEVDLCYRAHLHGWKVVFVPGTRVVHVRGGSTGVVPRRVLMLYRGKLQYFEKHFGGKERMRLYQLIAIATSLKLIVYTGLRILSFGRIKKDDLWKEVSQNLTKLVS